MGVLLKAYGNFKIDTNASFFDELEKLLGTKFKDSNLNGFETNNIDNVEYYGTKERFDKFFKENSYYPIHTNFTFCKEITVYRGALKFDPQGFKHRFHIWKNFQLPNFEMRKEFLSLKEDFEAWQLFKEFCINILKKVNGNLFLIIDDHSFQREEEIIFQGSSLEDFFDLIYSPISLNNSNSNLDENSLISVNDQFFYEIIN